MENRVKDIIRFYLQKHVRETYIKLNLIMKNGVWIYIDFIWKRHVSEALIKINIKLIFRKQTW
jgi:hypothetical protein